MKTKAIPSFCAVILGLALVTPCGAAEKEVSRDPDPGQVVLDTILVRPVCFVATAVGSVCFIVSLPFSVPSKSVHRVANSLVKKPAHATFKRPLGDMDSLLDY